MLEGIGVCIGVPAKRGQTQKHNGGHSQGRAVNCYLLLCNGPPRSPNPVNVTQNSDGNSEYTRAAKSVAEMSDMVRMFLPGYGYDRDSDREVPAWISTGDRNWKKSE